MSSWLARKLIVVVDLEALNKINFCRPAKPVENLARMSRKRIVVFLVAVLLPSAIGNGENSEVCIRKLIVLVWIISSWILFNFITQLIVLELIRLQRHTVLNDIIRLNVKIPCLFTFRPKNYRC